MLADEPFSDAPECAEPVIAAFLRALNDRLGHHERQRLVPYAAAVVGTRGAGGRACRDECLRYACGSTRLARLRMLVALGPHAALHARAGAGEWAARAVIARDDLPGALALLDAMLRACGGTPPGSEPAPLALPVRGFAQVG